MSDIQTPNGLEVNEALASTNEMEVYQSASGGVRRNKRALLSVLKTFFTTITVGTPTSGDILTSTGAALPQGSGVKVTEIADNASDIATNTADILTNAGDITSEAGTRSAADIAITADLDSRVLAPTGSPQGVGDDDGPTFSGGVQTDNIKTAERQVTGTTTGTGIATYTLPVEIVYTKILSVECYVNTSGTTWENNLFSSGGDIYTRTLITPTQVACGGGSTAGFTNKPYSMWIRYIV